MSHSGDVVDGASRLAHQLLNVFNLDAGTHETPFEGRTYPRAWLMFSAMSRTPFPELVEILDSKGLDVGLKRLELGPTAYNITRTLVAREKPAEGVDTPKARP
ncbi:hypothetical protein ACX6XY_10880 [Streptomyces sp. O3]